MIDTSTAQSTAEAMRGVTAYNMEKHRVKREILRRMRYDNVHGKTKTEIKELFLDGHYGKDFSGNKDGGQQAFRNYWNDMTHLFLDDFSEVDKEALRQRLLAKYMRLYEGFLAKGETKAAKATLDSLYKAAGLDQPSKSITLPEMDKGEITISFGLK